MALQQQPRLQDRALPFVLGAALGSTVFALVDQLCRRPPVDDQDDDQPTTPSTPPVRHFEGVPRGPSPAGAPGSAAPREKKGSAPDDPEEAKEAIADVDRPNNPKYIERLSDGSTYRINMLRGERFPMFGTERALRLEHSLVLPEGSVILDTFPKSGTTLTQRVVQILQGREDELVTSAVPWLLETFETKDLEEGLKEIAGCTVFKSHSTWANVKKQPGLKYIYVARDGRDVAVSMFHHSRGYTGYTFNGSWDVFLEEIFLTGKSESGSWFAHVRQWWELAQRWPDQILWLWYEDFLADPETYIRRVADWIGADADDELIRRVAAQTAFNAMKNDPKANYSWTNERRAGDQPGFIRKGISGDWLNYFTPRQAELYQQRFREEFAGVPELVEAFRARDAPKQQDQSEEPQKPSGPLSPQAPEGEAGKQPSAAVADPERT